MTADSFDGDEVLGLPAAQFRELRSYLELEFAKQQDLLHALLHGGSGSTRSTPLPNKLSGGEVRPVYGEQAVVWRSPESQEPLFDDDDRDGEKESAGSSVTRVKKETVWHENHMAQAQEQATHLKRVRSASESEVNETWRTLLRRIVDSDRFGNLIMAIIMANVVLMGIEVDVAANLGEDDIPQWFNTVNLFMVGAFVIEATLKHLAFGCRGFWCGDDFGWNIFDFAVVLVSVVEVFLDVWAQSVDANSGQVRMLRTVRLVRALRGMRLVRVFRYVVALRTLILSIIATTGSLIWTLLLFVMLCYSFGMAIAQFATDHCRFQAIERTMDPNAIPECPEGLRTYWSSVETSMLTLFLAISGGISWDVALRPLQEFSVLPTALLMVYIFIAVFAILNVVTGVFCNTAIESAHADKELATVLYERSKKSQIETLRMIFEEMDFSSADHISIHDIERATANGRLAEFLGSMGISLEDVWTFFMLIDMDGNGLLDLDEFVSGCMQLNGPARSIQLAKMSYENKVSRREIRSIAEDLKQLSEQVQADASPQESRRRISCAFHSGKIPCLSEELQAHPRHPTAAMAAHSSNCDEVHGLPAAQFRELRSYLELEFAKQHDLLNELIQRGSLPVGPLPSEELLSLLKSPKQIQAEERAQPDRSVDGDTASAGRYQGIVWTQSASEAVFTTQLLKRIREMELGIDEVARTFFKQEDVPDKHKDATKFMQRLSSDLADFMKAKLPQKATPGESAALIKAKAKLAAHGLQLTPGKRESQGNLPSSSDLPLQDSNPRAPKRAKSGKESSEEEAKKLLKSSPKNMLDSRPQGAMDHHVEDWLQTLKNKPYFYGKFTELRKHVSTVQELFKQGFSKQELTTAAVKFGLDENLASRLTIKNLSTAIAAAQFEYKDLLSVFMCRYVDNRLILSDTKPHRLGAIRKWSARASGYHSRKALIRKYALRQRVQWLTTFLSKLDELHPGYNADDFFPQGMFSFANGYDPANRYDLPKWYKEIKLLALAILRSKIDYEVPPGSADDKLDQLILKANEQRRPKFLYQLLLPFSEESQDLPDNTEDLIAVASAFTDFRFCCHGETSLQTSAKAQVYLFGKFFQLFIFQLVYIFEQFFF
ncbi:CACNA1G [Symbiodinium microadriaticum]|nr:CACNA1G [Symbiodinium microadriaticum]